MMVHGTLPSVAIGTEVDAASEKINAHLYCSYRMTLSNVFTKYTLFNLKVLLNGESDIDHYENAEIVHAVHSLLIMGPFKFGKLNCHTKILNKQYDFRILTI